MGHAALAGARQDLFDTTLDWSLAFLDRDRHLVWNPSWYDAKIPTRTVHLTPNSAWVAYGLLSRGDPWSVTEARDILRAVMDLQYTAPDAAHDGTYARFAESPEPGAGAVAWQDFDHNWRQFVGTTFALILEDFPAALPSDLASQMEQSVERACRGEPAGRIALDYTNPALMHAWMTAWYGRRSGDVSLYRRGHEFAAALAARFDELGGFAEWNSPTYYGMDLFALALWRELPPDDLFRAEGARLASALWAETAERYHPRLRNWCGPYGRSYGPDATRSVTLLGLWHWAAWGRARAPLPSIGEIVDVGANHASAAAEEARLVAESHCRPAGAEGSHGENAEIHHSNDLMAGPLIARLAPQAPGREPELAGERMLRRHVGPRRFDSWLGPSLMLGAESVETDWQGSGQAAVFTAHWSEPNGVATLWLSGPRRLLASVSPYHVELEQTAGETPLRFKASGLRPRVSANVLSTQAMRVRFGGGVTALEVRAVTSPGAPEEIEIVPQADGRRTLSLEWEAAG